jgi:hypothetical protein
LRGVLFGKDRIKLQRRARAATQSWDRAAGTSVPWVVCAMDGSTACVLRSVAGTTTATRAGGCGCVTDDGDNHDVATEACGNRSCKIEVKFTGFTPPETKQHYLHFSITSTLHAVSLQFRRNYSMFQHNNASNESVSDPRFSFLFPAPSCTF